MPYFDHNATTPLNPAAREAWLRASEEAWQNPASLHRAGTRVKLRLQHARENLAAVIGCEVNRVVFTGGATEAVYAIARRLADSLPAERKIAVNPTEHTCVIEALRTNFTADRLVWLAVDDQGRIDADVLDSMLAAEDIGAVWVMAANNETGVLQPWANIAQMCRDRGVVYVCDAAQWWGKLAGGGLATADWVVAAGHKWGAPKGTGFLLKPADETQFSLRVGKLLASEVHRGTEDFPGAASLVAALVDAERRQVMLESDRVQLRERFERDLRQALPGVQVVGAQAERLWNTVSVIMPFGENHRWVTQLDKLGFEVSTGSACSSGSEAPSHVLAAMGVPGEAIRRVLRISSSWSTTPADWTDLIEALVTVAAKVKPTDNVISI